MIISFFKRSGFAFLIGIFPLVYNYTHNIFHIPFEQVIAPTIIVSSLTGILLTGFYFLYKNLVKASVITSIFWLLFFSYSAIHTLLTDKFVSSFFAKHSFIVAGIALVFLLLGLSLKSWRIPNNSVKVAYAFALVLLFSPTLKTARYFYNEASVPSTSKVTLEEKIDLNIDKTTLPDIVYVILDGYGREDMLKKNYGLDNRYFIDSLKKHDFHVADSSYSNYCRTAVTVASVFNMNYVHELENFNENQSYNELDKLTEESYLVRLLKLYDYNIYSFASGFDVTELTSNATFLTPNPSSLTQFDYLIFSLTPYIIIENNNFLFKKYCELLQFISPNTNPAQQIRDHHRDRINFALDSIPAYIGKDKPSFVFADIFVGHPPFIFDSNGIYKDPKTMHLSDGNEFIEKHKAGVEFYINGSREQTIHINNRLISMVHNLKQNITRPTVIIMQGDHGPGAFYHQHEVSKTNLDDRFSILSAIYFSDDKQVILPQDLTPVNNFRIILNKYFNIDAPLLPNRQFYSGQNSICKFIEVSEALKH